MSNAPQYTALISRLRSLANPVNVAGMARFGISSQNTLGISVAVLRPIAKEIGRDQALSEMLWQSGIHEARILAAYVGIPARVTEEQMERWVRDFESWDVCDQVCSNLFASTDLAYPKALEWSRREPEFVKRAGFVMMASLAVKDKKAANSRFEQFFESILSGSTDNRNFVKKAVNWALRQVGKRNCELNRKALNLATKIQNIDSAGTRWIASDAIRELSGPAVQSKFKSPSLRAG